VQKSRDVPDYEQRAVNQTWYTWKLWEWAPARSLEKKGTGTATVWPSDEEVALGKKLKTGEQERAKRVATYAVVVSTKGGPRDVPLREESELAQYPAAKAVVLRVWPSGRVDVL
jgi:cytolysin (calcineurin-like family phosphatase)